MSIRGARKAIRAILKAFSKYDIFTYVSCTDAPINIDSDETEMGTAVLLLMPEFVTQITLSVAHKV